MGTVTIVDNGGANIASLRYALERLGAASELTTDPRELRAAERVILPGVGTAADAMSRLRTLGLDTTLRSLAQPVLGICLGMQLLFAASDEADEQSSETRCLGIIDERVRRMTARVELPVPHMGWNRLRILREEPLLRGIEDGSYVYFVHGYAAPVGPWTVATADYGGEFAAVVRQRNFHGTQFHPERSAATGSRVLANFLSLDSCA